MMRVFSTSYDHHYYLFDPKQSERLSGGKESYGAGSGGVLREGRSGGPWEGQTLSVLRGNQLDIRQKVKVHHSFPPTKRCLYPRCIRDNWHVYRVAVRAWEWWKRLQESEEGRGEGGVKRKGV